MKRPSVQEIKERIKAELGITTDITAYLSLRSELERLGVVDNTIKELMDNKTDLSLFPSLEDFYARLYEELQKNIVYQSKKIKR